MKIAPADHQFKAVCRSFHFKLPSIYMMIHGFLAESASPAMPTATITPSAILSIVGDG
jgi:hypothetical protein